METILLKATDHVRSFFIMTALFAIGFVFDRDKFSDKYFELIGLTNQERTGIIFLKIGIVLSYGFLAMQKREL